MCFGWITVYMYLLIQLFWAQWVSHFNYTLDHNYYNVEWNGMEFKWQEGLGWHFMFCHSFLAWRESDVVCSFQKRNVLFHVIIQFEIFRLHKSVDEKRFPLIVNNFLIWSFVVAISKNMMSVPGSETIRIRFELLKKNPYDDFRFDILLQKSSRKYKNPTIKFKNFFMLHLYRCFILLGNTVHRKQ